MKKLFFSGLTLLAGLVSCSDNSYKNLPVVNEDDDPTPTPVLLSLGMPNSSIITKGIGSIGDEKGTNEAWNGAKVYVFSFLKDSENKPTDFTENMEAYDGEKPLNIPNCLIDGSIDDPTSSLGKEAIVNGVDNTIKWTQEEKTGVVYFPSAKKAYDFYAYYIDDIMPTNINRTKDNISFDVTINGTQDLMSAKAAITAEQETIASPSDLPNIKDLAFSSYTARRGIQPIIQFKHHLVRLKFEIYSGHVDADKVYVEKITVKSKNQGVFHVVARSGKDTIIFNNDYVDFNLRDKGEENIKQDFYKTNTFVPGTPVFDSTPVTVGESVMAAPDSEYTFQIKLKQDGVAGSYVTNWTLTVPDKDGKKQEFEKGHQYTVRIAIYGLQKTDIKVVPEAWKVGDDITVDEDAI